MKKFILFLSLTVLLSPAFAQNLVDNKGQNDPKAKVILDKVSAKYEAYTSMKSTFTIKIEDTKGVQKEDPQSGTLYLKGNKFKVELGDQEISCDGMTLWTYLTDVNEVQISDYEPSADMIEPSELFSVYDQDFLYKLNADVTEGGITYNEIELTPIDKDNSGFFKIKMYINKTDYSIVKAKIYSKNNLVFIYKVDSFTANPSLTDDFFKFDATKYKGITITDLR